MNLMTNADAYKRSYSLADIARKLNRPRTTVQAWRDQFKPYLPTVSGTKGRTLRYEESALSIFELIARMKDETTAGNDNGSIKTKCEFPHCRG